MREKAYTSTRCRRTDFLLTLNDHDISPRLARGRLRGLSRRLRWLARLGVQALRSWRFPRMEKTRARIAREVARYHLPMVRWQLRLHLRKDFSFEQLAGVDLRHLRFRRVSLRGANLTGASLDGHILEADLTDAVLHNASIAGLDLARLPDGIDFARVRLLEVRCSSRRDSHIVRVRGADLTGADLRAADLRGADLRAVNLSGADLRGAKLAGADLGGRANLRGANLAGATLFAANLAYADLLGANLREADLREANIWQTDLRMADLTAANLAGADLCGAIRDSTAMPGI